MDSHVRKPGNPAGHNSRIPVDAEHQLQNVVRKPVNEIIGGRQFTKAIAEIARDATKQINDTMTISLLKKIDQKMDTNFKNFREVIT